MVVPFDCRNLQSVPEFHRLAKTLIYRVEDREIPDMLQGNPALSNWQYIYEIMIVAEEAVESVGDDRTKKDRMLYVLVADDYSSRARLGRGKWDRPLASQTAFLMEWSGYSARHREGGKRFWPIQPRLVKSIAANGGVVCWFPLLETITHQQAVIGERALFNRYGLSKWGGLWDNEIEN